MYAELASGAYHARLPAAQRVASFQQDGTVVLGPDGVRLCLAALELETRRAARRNGGAAPTSDTEWLASTLTAAERTAGCVPATSGPSFTMALPSSDATVTVTEAARIWAVSTQAVRKAIKAGRLTARRHGGAWLLSETEIRQAAGRTEDSWHRSIRRR